MIVASFGGACLTGLLAQVRIPLPFTPVPVTGQVLAVLLCGALLGSRCGLFSQVSYVVLGAAGVPWFAGGSAGLGVMFGPTAFTAGYLLGFIAAAFFLGTISERSAWAESVEGQVTSMLAAVAIIYVFGVLHLMFSLRVTLARAMVLGVVPFVAVDVLKALLAALFASKVLQRSWRVVEKGR